MKNRFVTIGIIVATLILAGVAVFTAIRLYQSRNEAVAPNVPSSKPAAANPNCTLTFSFAIGPTASPTATGTATATATATSTATASPTATANPQCNTSCSSNSDCPSQYICYKTSGATTGNCRNAQCLTETDCLCAVATSTPTATSTATTAGKTATPTSTSQPSLPDAGTSWPTVIGTAFGIIVILGSILLAL